MMEKKKLITHNGSFHADDLFAAATLALWLDQENEDYEIIRTRDQGIIESGDFVFDVGGIYEFSINRFDHHQRGGAGKHENGIPYSSFGLVWKHFGLSLCDNNQKAFEIIDKKIVMPLDAIDNGVDLVSPKFGDIFPFSASEVFLIFSPTWKEDGEKIDKIFKEQVMIAKKFLAREIKVLLDDIEAEEMILDCYKKSEDKSIIELDRSFPRYLYQRVLSRLPEPIYLIYKSEYTDEWKVEAISKNPLTFESRKLLPESWRGFVDQDPKAGEVIGIDGVRFTHNSGFLASTNSRDSAFLLAQKALES